MAKRPSALVEVVGVEVGTSSQWGTWPVALKLQASFEGRLFTWTQLVDASVAAEPVSLQPEWARGRERKPKG